MAAHVKVQANEIAANSGKTVLGNIAAYKQSPAIADMDGGDLVCKDNLTEIVPDVPDKIEFVIAVGDTLPYQRSLPSSMQGGVIVQQWRCLSGGVRELASDALPRALMLDPPTTINNLIQRLDFAGYDDGTGHQMDPPLYYTISKA